ncbi:MULTISPECIES: SoxR reducing system RseC family protein [Pseudomonas]|uniref:SoxR reducing system RseC family protein n=1 Tax=Pseudomonas TaxID=286 RepID=UPI0006D408D0|nr:MULTISPECIES: SoxR reducing system RseC family protein [Pseudomonas]MCE4070402.1 SoxR reducing system RseC family protein [Pseudomonas nitritireducens]MCE4079007.1 SoxR reducing system RseC family protein [Pseudomonas nitroreducens]OBY89789.1 transcriptional regulator [Pseudomonas sp. AU11447]
MIQERGRVIAVESGAVQVETLRYSTCSGCSASAGCGHGLLRQLGVVRGRGGMRVLSSLALAPGDEVVLGMDEDLLLKSALLFYLSPLIGLFTLALLAAGLDLGEPLIIVAGLAGFLLAWLLVRHYTRRHTDDPAMQPVVLRALVGGPPGPV